MKIFIQMSNKKGIKGKIHSSLMIFNDNQPQQTGQFHKSLNTRREDYTPYFELKTQQDKPPLYNVNKLHLL